MKGNCKLHGDKRVLNTKCFKGKIKKPNWNIQRSWRSKPYTNDPWREGTIRIFSSTTQLRTAKFQTIFETLLNNCFFISPWCRRNKQGITSLASSNDIITFSVIIYAMIFVTQKSGDRLSNDQMQPIVHSKYFHVSDWLKPHA